MDRYVQDVGKSLSFSKGEKSNGNEKTELRAAEQQCFGCVEINARAQAK
jgi:hypothetical protein